ncbi:hypothetical protein HLH33_17165 [Gluconacetobacter diazotrophicus]|uniref:Uncharacterized protein n=1 Tax=Gluconacetobacter diazotrophicus TaxID=33996 RepID=A0A7W4I821_GLUDI|nr:hypothetical protein [Gluconacetobacter diazotrophicus]MBB2158004.1 hypothetical protein [Gluconacetobacter diazotrophicus]
MPDNETTGRKSMIRSVIVFLLAPVAASIALIVGVLHMATYVGPDLRQFDPETEMGLRVFGLAVLGLVGVYLAGRRIVAARDKRHAEERTDHA